MNKKLPILPCLAFFLASSAFADTGKAHGILIRAATVIDGRGASPSPDTDIEIIGDRIQRVGRKLKSSATQVIDARGLFVTPGLIDAHVHLHSVPGAEFRGDSPQAVREQRDWALRAYVAAGVTTVLDAAAPESLLREQAARPADGPEPRILGLAPFLTPAGGYFGSEAVRGSQYADLWAPVSDPQEVARSFERAGPLHPLGAKVTFEKGFGPFDTWPVFGGPMREAIVREARRLGLPIFAHSMSEEEHRLALSLQPYALMHAGFPQEPPGPGILKEIKEEGAFVVTTVAIYKMMLLMWQGAAMADPWLRRLVPPAQLETAMDPRARTWVIRQAVAQMKPAWCPRFVAEMFSAFFFNEGVAMKQLSNSLQAVRLMHDAGIPLVMGSDAGNWPVWTSFFHGAGSILEMEGLEEAGIPRSDIIVAATSRAARMLRINGEVGTIEPGKIADLLVVEGNPLARMSALREVRLVVKGGQARSPLEWMHSTP